MAAAKLNKGGDLHVRRKIQVSMLINRLQDDAFGRKSSGRKDAGIVQLTTGQRESIKILLGKSLPDLAHIQVTGADNGPLICSWLAPK